MWACTRVGVVDNPPEIVEIAEMVEIAETEPRNSKNWSKLYQRVSNVFYKPIDKKEFRKRTRQNTSMIVGPKEDESEEDRGPASLSVSLNLSKVHNLDEKSKCMICCLAPNNCIIMGCGHGGICYECGLNLKRKNNKCHVCRSNIDDFLIVKQDILFAEAIDLKDK